MSDVPVQFYQSVIAIELAVAGALLFQMRFFSPRDSPEEKRDVPDARIRFVMAVVLGATLFGCLYGMKHGGQAADEGVTVGLGISLLPILLRVLPPLGRDPEGQPRDPQWVVTIAGLVTYALLIGAAIVLVG